MCSTPFWGDVGIKKWSWFFCSGTRSAIFFHVKTGTFAESARFHLEKNGTSGAGTKKPRPLFDANIPPKWCRTRLFYAFCTFEWNLSQFSKIAYFWSFLTRFYCNTGEKLKVPRDSRRSAQIKKLKKTNQL